MSDIFYAVVIIFILLCLFLYRYITYNNNYWKEKGIPYEPPAFIFGFLKDFILRRKARSELYKEIYAKYPNERMVGVFNMRTPELIIRDLEDIKTVLISEFSHFIDRGNFVTNDPVSRNLFSVNSDTWKVMRQKLTPIFTTGKMKNMFPLMIEVGNEFTVYLDNSIKKQNDVECKELMAKFTTDIIGTCAFGIKMNSMSDEDNPFRIMGRTMFEIRPKILFREILRNFAPRLFYVMGFIIGRSKVADFFLSIVKKSLDDRIISGKKRNDLIDLLIELRQNEEKLLKDNNFNNKEKFLNVDDNFVAAQSLLFFGAGHETSSSVMGYTLHELALNPEIQDKVYEEIQIKLKKYNGEITYDFIFEMKYLDMVINESHRKHTIATSLPRMCSSPYTFSGMDKPIDKGVLVSVAVGGIHHDPKYYPDPEKFIPERFTEEEKQKRHPMTFLPFGDGPRNCIGLRFGKMQVTLGLITLLKDFSVEPCSKTVPKVRYNPWALIPSSIDGLWLKIKKRNAT